MRNSKILKKSSIRLKPEDIKIYNTIFHKSFTILARGFSETESINPISEKKNTNVKDCRNYSATTHIHNSSFSHLKFKNSIILFPC